MNAYVLIIAGQEKLVAHGSTMKQETNQKIKYG